jgi:hypothetical protein
VLTYDCSGDEEAGGDMGHYFFDTNDGDCLLVDEEGVDLDSVAAVRMAHRALFEVASEGVVFSGPARKYSVSVRDSNHRVVYEASVVFSGKEF